MNKNKSIPVRYVKIDRSRTQPERTERIMANYKEAVQSLIREGRIEDAELLKNSFETTIEDGAGMDTKWTENGEMDMVNDSDQTSNKLDKIADQAIIDYDKKAAYAINQNRWQRWKRNQPTRI